MGFWVQIEAGQGYLPEESLVVRVVLTYTGPLCYPIHSPIRQWHTFEIEMLIYSSCRTLDLSRENSPHGIQSDNKRNREKNLGLTEVHLVELIYWAISHLLSCEENSRPTSGNHFKWVEKAPLLPHRHKRIGCDHSWCCYSRDSNTWHSAITTAQEARNVCSWAWKWLFSCSNCRSICTLTSPQIAFVSKWSSH
jgi:hypothetical protein